MTKASLSDLAETALKRWAIESHGGGGPPNIIAKFGDPVGTYSEACGPPIADPGFSTLAALADRIIKDLRSFDSYMSDLIVRRAVDMTPADIAREFKISEHRARLDSHEAFGAFLMGFHLLK